MSNRHDTAAPLHAPGPAVRPRSARRRWALRLVALGVATTIALVAGEVAVRVLRPQDLSGSWRVACASRGQLINRAGGTARHQLGERVVRYRFNAHHLRGPEIDPQRPRVLCLGDSYTFGWLLEEDQTFVRRLEQRAQGELGLSVQCLIGGAGGWGTAHYLAFLETYGPAIKPELLLVFLNGDDIGRSLRTPLYTLRDASGSALEAHDVPVPRLKQIVGRIPLYPWLLEHSHLLQLARRRATGSAVPRPAAARPARRASSVPSRAARLGQALFLRLAAWCREHACALQVLTTGFQDQVAPDPDGPTGQFLAGAAAFFAEQRIAFADLQPAVRAQAGRGLAPYVIPGDLHPNEAGSQLIARAAWPIVRARLLTLFPEVAR